MKRHEKMDHRDIDREKQNLSRNLFVGGTVESGGKICPDEAPPLAFPSPARRGRVARQGRERVSSLWRSRKLPVL
jgi:hypothetical protein